MIVLFRENFKPHVFLEKKTTETQKIGRNTQVYIPHFPIFL